MSLIICALLACAPSREDRLAEIQALQAKGRYYETIEPVMELFEESPDDPIMIRLYAFTMLAVEIPGLAMWPLRTLAESPDGGVDEHLLLARALRQAGAEREAYEVIKEVVAAEPDHVEGLILQGGLAVEKHDHEVTLSTSEALIRIDPRQYAVAHAWKAKALIGLDRFEEADQVLEATIETLSARPDSALWRANLCKISIEVAEAQEDTDQVAQRWETCLDQFPINSEMVNEGITFFDETEDTTRANAILERAIETAPNDIAWRSLLAKRLAAERREDEGEQILLELTHTSDDTNFVSRVWLALAEYHRNLDNFAEAVQAAEQGISGLQSVPELVIAQIADDCIQSNNLERAEELIATIETPEYVSLLSGRIALARGNPQRARDELLEGLKHFQGNAAARYLAAQAAAQLGDLDVAIQGYRDAVRSGPGESDAAFELARLYEAQGNLIGAHHILGMRRVKMSHDFRVHDELAALAIKYMTREVAQSVIDEIDELPGHQVDVVLAQARLEARHEGADAGARTIEKQAADREMKLTLPENEKVLRELVHYLARSDRNAEGLTIAQAASEAFPDFAPFQETLAIALTMAEQPSEDIEKAWARALELDPMSTLSLAGQAMLATESQQIDEAIRLYDLAIDADPENLNAAWNAVQLALDEGREEEVNKRLEQILMKDPIHARAVTLLARRLLDTGTDLDRAEELAIRAIRFGGNVSALETLGLLSLERGDTARALRSFRVAVQRRPGSPSLRYHLARALIANDNHEAAAEALRGALQNEDFPEANEAREELARLEAEQANE